MAKSSFRVTLSGDAALRGRIVTLASRLQDMQPPLRAFSRHAAAIPARSIKEGVSPETGSAFKPTSPFTLGLRPGGGGGGKTLYDTGRLVRSFLASKVEYTKMSMRLGSPVEYALLQQLGGTVLPKTARMLAIPLQPEARKAGGARRWWSKYGATRRPFIRRGPSGKLFIFGKDGAHGVKPFFMLLDKVTVVGRPYLGFKREDRELFLSLLVAHAAKEASGNA